MSSTVRGVKDSTSAVIKKSAVSLTTLGVTYLITTLVKLDQEAVVIVSVFIGGAVLIAQFMVEFEGRLTALEHAVFRYHGEISGRISRRISDIGEAAELFSLIEASVVPSEDAREFLRQVSAISPVPRLRQQIMQDGIVRLTDFLRQLNYGTAVYQGEDRDWLLALTQAASRSIDALSLHAVDGGARGFEDGFWENELGNLYLELQKNAIDRSVVVRRIFVLDRPETAEEESFRQTCRRQVDLQIDVRVLKPADIPPGVRGALADVILFDDEISYEVTPGTQVTGEPRRPTIITTRIVSQREVVERHRRRFNLLWEAATRFE